MTQKFVEILGFGDSLTAGTPGYEPGYGGDPQSQYGFWLLESAKNDGTHNLRFTNSGVPGELAATMNQRLRNQIRRQRYDIVVLMAGSNDLGWGTPSDEVFRILRGLWAVVAEQGSALVACTIPPIAESYPRHQDSQRRLNSHILAAGGPGHDRVAVDVFSALADSHGLLLPDYDSGDGLHLSVEGYRAIGEIVWSDGVRKLIHSSFQA
jgi:lysophospholipase L1-like esterase